MSQLISMLVVQLPPPEWMVQKVKTHTFESGFELGMRLGYEQAKAYFSQLTDAQTVCETRA